MQLDTEPTKPAKEDQCQVCGRVANYRASHADNGKRVDQLLCATHAEPLATSPDIHLARL